MAAGCLGTETSGIQQVSERSPATLSSINITDSTGDVYHFDRAVNRIISQNDDATELLNAIGADDKIVGVTDLAMNKPYLQEKFPHATSIGDWLFPDVETILALKPDVMVTYSTSKPRNLDKLQNANVTVVNCDAYRLNSLLSDTSALGLLTGNEDKARHFIDFNKRYLSLVESRLPENSTGYPLRVYAEAYSDYSVMTERSAGGQYLEALHVRNIYGNHTSDWATVSPEWVIAQNPDVIIKFATDPAKGENLSSVRVRIMNRAGYSTISAVKNHRVYVLDGNLGSSPRAVIGLVYAAKAIYPDKFDDIDPVYILDEYSQEFVHGKYL
ncbi:MAG: ABC transporter substrate-binding protein [Methanospirillum sp.]|nr:ABC transporter substrate-binding protein [Methanospirillum sp.]